MIGRLLQKIFSPAAPTPRAQTVASASPSPVDTVNLSQEYPESSRPEAYQALVGDLSQAAPYKAQTIQEFQPIRGSLGEYCESRGVLAVGVELGKQFKPVNEEREQVQATGLAIAMSFLDHMAGKVEL